MLMLMTTLQCIERCRGCSVNHTKLKIYSDLATDVDVDVDDNIAMHWEVSRVQQRIPSWSLVPPTRDGWSGSELSCPDYHTLHCWPLSHTVGDYHTGQTVKILSFLPDYHTIMLLLCQTHYQAQIQTKLHYFVACRIHSHCMAIPARLQLLWFGIRLVDHPTQLICIWIFICQHTKKKDIAG